MVNYSRLGGNNFLYFSGYYSLGVGILGRGLQTLVQAVFMGPAPCW